MAYIAEDLGVSERRACKIVESLVDHERGDRRERSVDGPAPSVDSRRPLDVGLRATPG